jgi:single-strand DNA-binding protein
MVEGRLKLDQWEDKQSGQKRSKLKIVLDNVQFLSSRSSGGAPHAAPDAGAAPAAEPERPAAGAPPAASKEGAEEDVPF